MNRADRRSLGIKNHEPVYIYKKSELNKAVIEDYAYIEKDIRNKVITQLMGVMVTTLHKTLGLGKQRIHKFIDEFNNQFNLIETGQTTFEELNKLCEKYEIKTKIEEA